VIVVDTDILIWILRGNADVVQQFKAAVAATGGFVYITPVQVAEVFAGMREGEVIKTRDFLQSMLLLPLDYRIGEEAGTFLNQFKGSHGVTLADSMIAAATRCNALKIWTFNRKHYPMLDTNDFWEPSD
jgi:predicted nucleic acid-binding protein